MQALKLALVFLVIGLLTVHAQESTTAQPVTNLEIGALVESAKLSQWADIAKSSNFLSTKPKITGVDKYGGVHASGAPPIMRDWEDVYGRPASRNFRDGWKPEVAQAEALLKRPCKDDQRKWLVKFIDAATAIEQKDAKTFKDIVPALVDDYRTLL